MPFLVWFIGFNATCNIHYFPHWISVTDWSYIESGTFQCQFEGYQDQNLQLNSQRYKSWLDIWRCSLAWLSADGKSFYITFSAQRLNYIYRVSNFNHLHYTKLLPAMSDTSNLHIPNGKGRWVGCRFATKNLRLTINLNLPPPASRQQAGVKQVDGSIAEACKLLRRCKSPWQDKIRSTIYFFIRQGFYNYSPLSGT